MINPYASPTSDLSETPLPSGVLLVRWTRPSFRTFGRLAILCGFSMGIVVGIAGFVQSLFGVETELFFVIWRFQGITAGVLGILLGPLILAILSFLPITLFPLFRLGVFFTNGPRLLFHGETDESPRLSCIYFVSYLKLCAILGFLLSLFGAICLVTAIAAGGVSEYGVSGVPIFFDGAARLVWVVTAGAFLHSLYAVLLGVLAFIPFRVVTRVTGTSIPTHEVVLTGSSQRGC